MATGRTSKHKTRSGCTGIELASAFLTLQKLRDKIRTEEIFEPDDSSEIDVEIDKYALTKLDNLLEWMDPKMKNWENIHMFSSANLKLMSGIPITEGRPLRPKENAAQRAEVMRSLGVDHVMSSKNLRDFLDMLLHLVARPSEASVRTWVDAILYRALAMLSSRKKMVLNVKHNISPVSIPTSSGSEIVLVGPGEWIPQGAQPGGSLCDPTVISSPTGLRGEVGPGE